MTSHLHELSIDALEEVARKVGGKSELARMMGISRSSLYDYIRRRRLTSERCIQMEKLSGVPRERILPNLFRPYGQRQDVA